MSRVTGEQRLGHRELGLLRMGVLGYLRDTQGCIVVI